MDNKDLLEKAINIAVMAHSSQTDKNGEPYIGHLFRVMNMCKSTKGKICGVLHDLIEDTNWTIEKLQQEGFPSKLTDIIACLTHKPNEDYSQYIKRVSNNKTASLIKIYDLTDNLDVRRLEVIETKDVERLNKYLNAYKLLIKTNAI